MHFNEKTYRNIKDYHGTDLESYNQLVAEGPTLTDWWHDTHFSQAFDSALNDEREACLSFYAALYYLKRNRIFTGESQLVLYTQHMNNEQQILENYAVINTLNMYTNPLVISISISLSACICSYEEP